MSFWVYPPGVWPVDKTWISNPGEIPDDLPEEFDLDDLQGEPDTAGLERAAKQKRAIDDI